MQLFQGAGAVTKHASFMLSIALKACLRLEECDDEAGTTNTDGDDSSSISGFSDLVHRRGSNSVLHLLS